MNRIGVLLFALLLSGGFCLLALGHALFSMICRICRPLDEWRNEQIRIIEAWQEEDECCDNKS